MNEIIMQSVMGNNKFNEMSDQVFTKFSTLIYNESGIKLNISKKIMLTSRLNKRLKELSISSYSEYYDYVSSAKSKNYELHRMIDVVSTNKTDFFREDAHFNFLLKEALPVVAKNKETVNVWSAGCSSGEEAYSIAVVCAEYFGNCMKKFRILATDISTRVLEAAEKAIYQDTAIECIPNTIRRKYFMMGTGNKTGYHKVVPEIRDRVDIKRHNLVNDDFKNIPMMDFIFCRNVVIYFDRETQIKLHQKLLEKLNNGGYLFIGHSESLYSYKSNVERIEPTVYRKIG